MIKNLLIKWNDYYVSSEGKVYSEIKRGRKATDTMTKGKRIYNPARSQGDLLVCKPYENNNGYLRVKLLINGKSTQIFVYQLVLLAFKRLLKPEQQQLIDTYEANHMDNKPKQPNDLVIDHIDRNIKNNSLSNLRIITQAENLERRKYD